MNLSAMIGKVFFTQSQPRSVIYGTRLPYTGEQLREIRKRNGVGWGPWRGVCLYRSLIASLNGEPAPNLVEWNRKQRRGETLEEYRLRRFNMLRDGIAASLEAMGYAKAT